MEEDKGAEGELVMIFIIALFAALSMMFFFNAIGWISCPQEICPTSWETQDHLQASVVLATIGMVFFVGLQTYFSRKSFEQMRSSMLLPLMRDHTLQLREKAIKPLLEFFDQSNEVPKLLIDEENKRVFLVIDWVKMGRLGIPTIVESRVVNGTETLEDLVTHVADSKANPFLVKDLLNNHAPDLKAAYEVLVQRIKSLEIESDPDKKQELIENIKEQIEKLREILLELEAVEVFLDQCGFVKGSKRENRKSKK